MRWNLRLAAANRGIWKASELQRAARRARPGDLRGKMSEPVVGPAGVAQARRPGRHVRRTGLSDRRTAHPRARPGHPARTKAAAPEPARVGGAQPVAGWCRVAVTAARCPRPDTWSRATAPAARSPARSPAARNAWPGGLTYSQGVCLACYNFAARHRSHAGECGACRRSCRSRTGYCRLCWCQAREDRAATAATPGPRSCSPRTCPGSATTSCSWPA